MFQVFIIKGINSLSLSKMLYDSALSRVFANGPGDQSSIPGQVIPKTQKMALDATLLNTQHYKVQIKGKVEEIQEKELRPSLYLSVVPIEKGAFGAPTLFLLSK